MDNYGYFEEKKVAKGNEIVADKVVKHLYNF